MTMSVVGRSLEEVEGKVLDIPDNKECSHD